MGATTFDVRSKGKTASEAFKAAVDSYRHEYGHGGYTGTIAEKRSFVVIPLPASKNPTEYAYELIDAEDRRIDDKWGPAGCIKCPEPDTWLFFGWASE